MRTPCQKIGTDLFSQTPLQKSFTSYSDITAYPETSIENSSVLEFNFNNTDSDSYLGLYENIFSAVFEAYDETGVIAADYTGGPVADVLNSTIEGLKLYANNKLIETTNNYGYISYLTNITNRSKNHRETQGRSSLFIKDTPGEYESVAAKNTGLSERMTATKAKFSVSGPLVTGLLGNTETLIPSNIPIKIVIERQKPEFYMMDRRAGNAMKGFHLKMISCSLSLTKYRIHPDILQQQLKKLQGENMRINFRYPHIKTYLVPAGHPSARVNGLSDGTVPKQAIVAMVDSNASSGQYALNPYNFQTFDYQESKMSINGINVDNYDHGKLDFAKGFSAFYANFFRNLGYYNTNTGPDITMSDMTGGMFLQAFNLTNDRSSIHDGCLDPQKLGNLSYEVSFTKALTAPIQLIFYMVMDATLEITANKEVILNYVP